MKQHLVVKSAFADQGPTMKRFRPRAQGRAYRILKATSHITIVMELKKLNNFTGSLFVGQKTHPTGFRTGVNQKHIKQLGLPIMVHYSEVLKEDYKIEIF